jgi:hypothetical protein
VSERIERLKAAVEAACGCKATHAQSHPVTETFRGEVAWEGVVESFDLDGHPKEYRCYAFHIMTDDGPQFTTVLEIPPVDSAQTAVKVAIASKAKKDSP